MFTLTHDDKILLGKLVDAYYMANLSDPNPDGIRQLNTNHKGSSNAEKYYSRLCTFRR